MVLAELSWTDAEQTQAIDRIHRIGQDEPVTAWRDHRGADDRHQDRRADRQQGRARRPRARRLRRGGLVVGGRAARGAGGAADRGALRARRGARRLGQATPRSRRADAAAPDRPEVAGWTWGWTQRLFSGPFRGRERRSVRLGVRWSAGPDRGGPGVEPRRPGSPGTAGRRELHEYVGHGAAAGRVVVEQATDQGPEPGPGES